MSSEDRNLKRGYSSPEASQEKFARQNGHDSVIAIDKLTAMKPPLSPTTIRDQCEILGLNGVPQDINCVQVYNLVLELQHRMGKQEEEVKELKKQLLEKDDKITQLETEVKESFANIKIDMTKIREESDVKIETVKTELREVTVKVNNVPPQQPAADGTSSAEVAIDPNLAATVNRELPLVSEACAKAEVEITALKNEIVAIKKKAHLENDQKEQYSRREIIRITGVPQTSGEDTSVLTCRIAERLGVHVAPNDISVSHRSGRRNGTTPRPILCKFVRRETKYQILANKRLAGNITTDDAGNPVKIFIDEDLTAMRARVCKKLRGDKVAHHTRDGKVFISTSETDYKMYDTPTDWESLDWPVKVKQEIGLFPRD